MSVDDGPLCGIAKQPRQVEFNLGGDIAPTSDLVPTVHTNNKVHNAIAPVMMLRRFHGPFKMDPLSIFQVIGVTGRLVRCYVALLLSCLAARRLYRGWKCFDRRYAQIRLKRTGDELGGS